MQLASINVRPYTTNKPMFFHCTLMYGLKLELCRMRVTVGGLKSETRIPAFFILCVLISINLSTAQRMES